VASDRLEAASYSTTDRTSRPRDRQPWGSQNTTCAERVPRLCASLAAFRLDLGKSLRALPASGGGTFVGVSASVRTLAFAVAFVQCPCRSHA